MEETKDTVSARYLRCVRILGELSVIEAVLISGKDTPKQQMTIYTLRCAIAEVNKILGEADGQIEATEE